MKRTAFAAPALGALLAPAARAQVIELDQSNQPIIAVVGEGRASRPADYGELRFTYRGEGRTQVEALKDLAAQEAGN